MSSNVRCIELKETAFGQMANEVSKSEESIILELPLTEDPLLKNINDCNLLLDELIDIENFKPSADNENIIKDTFSGVKMAESEHEFLKKDKITDIFGDCSKEVIISPKENDLPSYSSIKGDHSLHEDIHQSRARNLYHVQNSDKKGDETGQEMDYYCILTENHISDLKATNSSLKDMIDLLVKENHTLKDDYSKLGREFQETNLNMNSILEENCRLKEEIEFSLEQQNDQIEEINDPSIFVRDAFKEEIATLKELVISLEEENEFLGNISSKLDIDLGIQYEDSIQIKSDALKNNDDLTKLQTIEDERASFTEEILQNNVEIDLAVTNFHPKDENLNEDNYALEDAISLLQMKIDSFELEIDILKERNYELEEERHFFKMESKNLVDQMHSLQDIIADHNVEINSLKNINNALIKDKHKDIKEEKEHVGRVIVDLRDEKDDYEEIRRELQDEIDYVEKEMNQLKGEKGDLEYGNVVLNCELNDLQTKLDELKDKKNYMEKKIDDMRGEKDVFNYEILYLKNEMDSLEYKILELEDEKGCIENTIDKLQRMKDDLEYEIVELKDEKVDVERKIVESKNIENLLEYEILELNVERDGIQEKIVELKDENKISEEKTNELHGQKDNLECKLIDLKIDKEELSYELVELKYEKDDIQKKISELKNIKDHVENELAQLKKELDELKVEKADFKMKVNNLQEEREYIEMNIIDVKEKTVTFGNEIEHFEEEHYGPQVKADCDNDIEDNLNKQTDCHQEENYTKLLSEEIIPNF